jgi:predicted secreted protein
MTTDWILRVGDGKNLIRSSKYKIWGIQTITSTHGKHFVENVKPGDRLWFIKSKSQGKIMAVAIYRSHNKRDLGPLLNITMSNEELGWTNDTTNWISDTEIHYTDLYNVSNCDMLTHIKGAATIRKYDEKCRVELAVEYSYIVRYSKITFEL